MAERRYGFRFSFAEGCVIVASLCGASFLVFLFGVYAGRELEARKAAEHTNSVRLAAPRDGESHPSSPDEKAPKDGQEKAVGASLTVPEAQKTVVIINPPRLNETPTAPHLGANPSAPTLPLPPPVKETEVKAETLQKSPSVSGERNPSSSAPPVPQVQAKTQPPKETPPVQVSKKLQATGGRWSVQVHATRDEGAAQQLVRQLRGQGYAPAISKVVRDGDVWYRVRVGSFANADEARSSVGNLRKNGKFSHAYPVSN
jgi:cell division septation protein DedD